MPNEGWIKLYRSEMDRPGYFGEEFCRNAAWFDLLLLANHAQNHYFIRGIKVTVNPGQVGYGLDELAKRWGWSRGKVERFLYMLEKESRIVRQKTNVTTLITVVVHENYDDDSKANGKADSNANDKANGHQTIKQTGVNKNVKNEKKYITKQEFFDQIALHVAEFGKETCRAFFNYWSEENNSGKMKFQLQKTWQLKNRLVTWKANESRFGNTGSSNGQQETPLTSHPSIKPVSEILGKYENL